MGLSDKAPRGVIIFASLTGLYFASIFHRVGLAAVAVSLQVDFAATSSILGLMSSMYFYSYAAAQIPAGLVADKLGVRKTVPAFGLIACLGNLLLSFSQTVEVLSLSRTLIGFGVGGFYVCALKALAFNFPRKRYATYTGILTSIGNLGAIAATSPLALLSLAIGWREAFLGIFFIIVVFVGMTWFFMHDSPLPLQPKVVGEKRSVLSDLKTIFANRELLKLAPVPFFVYGVFVSFQGLWVGPFLLQVYGMPQSVGSYFFIFISVGFVVTFPLAGFISDRIGRRKQVVLAGILLSLIGWVLLTFFGGALADYQIIALFSFIGVSYGVAVIFLTIPVNLCPPEISGLAIGSLNIFNFVGGGFFQFFMGYLLDLTSQLGEVFLPWQIIFGISAICVLLALLSAWRLNEKICG